MSRRNPLNERSQFHEGGKTRKSAASAKPVSKAASSVYIKDPNAKPKKSFMDRFKKKEEEPVKKKKSQQVETANTDTDAPKKKGGWTLNDLEGSTPDQSLEGLTEEQKKAARAKYRNPGDREYKKWRTIWWVIIICGVATLIPQFAMPEFINSLSSEQYILLLGVGYGLLITAVIIDALKIRPLRKRARSGAIAEDRSKEATAARKKAKKEAIAKEEAKAAKKASRKR